MKASVLECRKESGSSEVFLLNLKLEKGTEFNAGPGQFIVLEAKNDRCVMPRPKQEFHEKTANAEISTSLPMISTCVV